MSYLRKPEYFTFHDSIALAGNGAMYKNIEGRDVATFDILNNGTSTVQSYQFRGIGPGGNDNLITCYRATDSFGANVTSVKGETWCAPITGLEYFYIKALSLNGTSIIEGRIEYKS